MSTAHSIASAPELVKTGLVFNADGRELYFLGAQESQPDRTDIYVISENAPKPVLVEEGENLLQNQRIASDVSRV